MPIVEATDGFADRGVMLGDSPVFAALDLGTNNCRLLIAGPTARGYRVIDSFSRIVRLGEGVSIHGRLGEAAMERTIKALQICAGKMARERVTRLRAVATQACRAAANGRYFVGAVAARTGIRLSIISPREEARLSVSGCIGLLDPGAKAALVVDVGGGSTELSWVDLAGAGARVRSPWWRPPVKAWLSLPMGVVSLAENMPECGGGEMHFRRMVEAVKAPLAAFSGAERFRAAFASGQTHIVGTSGAITTLAALHLGLVRYDRRRVDGLWMTRAACEAVTRRLLGLTVAQRAAEPCIGPGRADLVLAGAAILAAVQEVWPCERVRVADRGLREGLLLDLIAGERNSQNCGATLAPPEWAAASPA